MIKSVYLTCLLLAVFATSALANEPLVRLRDLSGFMGQRVTVKVRTGVIVERREQGGTRAFTVRDDYGDLAVVLSNLPHPIFGATYFITGVPSPGETAGETVLREQSRKLANSVMPGWLLPVMVVVLAAAALVMGVVARRLGAALPPAWGYAEVIAGDERDKGKHFALRGARVVIGRDQDPTLAISIVGDTTVSREHGVILRKGKAVFYEDTHSNNGSIVDGNLAAAGERIALNPGVEIQLGTETKLRIGSPADATTTQTPGAPTGTWDAPEPGLTVTQ